MTRPVAEAGRNGSELRFRPTEHRRRPALAAGSLALVVACVAIFVSVYLKAGSQIEVLAVARTVPEGQIVSGKDLTVVRISTGPGVETLSANEASAVVGHRAAETLEPDSLLTASELVTSYSPPAGKSIVGVSAKEGQLPASGVAPGETVEVILTALPGESDVSTDSGAAEAQPGSSAATASGGEPSLGGTILVPDATVLEAVASPVSSGSDAIDVSLLTPSALAPLVANASAAGEVALVVVTPGS
jgi:SAF domain